VLHKVEDVCGEYEVEQMRKDNFTDIISDSKWFLGRERKTSYYYCKYLSVLTWASCLGDTFLNKPFIKLLAGTRLPNKKYNGLLQVVAFVCLQCISV
jgi:hypothetical protein